MAVEFITIKDAAGVDRNIAVDLVGTELHQLLKVEFGVDGAATMASSTNPLPVVDGAGNTALTAILAELGEKLEPGQAIELGATSLAALENISATITSSPEVEVKNDAGNPLAVTGPVTDGQLRATPVPVSIAELEIKNDSGSPLPVTGPLTDTQLRATGVPVVPAQKSTSALGTAGNGSASVGTTSSTIVPANGSRKGVSVVNDSANKVWLSLGAAAVAGSGYPLVPGGSWDGKVGDYLWQGDIRAVAAAASSNVSIVEV